MVARSHKLYSGAWGLAVIKNECFLVEVKSTNSRGYEVVKYRVLDHASQSFLVDLTEGFVDLSRPGSPMPTSHVAKRDMITLLSPYSVRSDALEDPMVSLDDAAFKEFLGLSTTNRRALQTRYDGLARFFRVGRTEVLAN